MSQVLIGIACEDEGHFSAATCLVDHALVNTHVWMDGIIEHCRTWRGRDESEPWHKYDPNDANDLQPLRVDGVTIKLHGHIAGEPLKCEAGMWRRVLRLFMQAQPQPDVVVLMRDLDGHEERREGMDQVREGIQWPFKVVIATPRPEVEAWHVAGFQPLTASERDALKMLKKDLSFDPTQESHRLTSHPNDAPRDAKRVLDRLCGEDPDRRMTCLSDAALLRQRGAGNGARAFLDEVDQRIVPVFVAPP